jgi:large subunit ribosomal protein L11
MAKKVTAVIKLHIEAGKATPAPPVGPALGQHGVNMMEFIKKFNDESARMMGMKLPVEIVVYEDRSYTYTIKQPLAADLLRRAAGVEKGAGNPLMDRVGSITPEKLREVARIKMKDLNAEDEEAAMRVLAGTARSMGIEIEGYTPPRAVATAATHAKEPAPVQAPATPDEGESEEAEE